MSGACSSSLGGGVEQRCKSATVFSMRAVGPKSELHAFLGATTDTAWSKSRTRRSRAADLAMDVVPPVHARAGRPGLAGGPRPVCQARPAHLLRGSPAASRDPRGNFQRISQPDLFVDLGLSTRALSRASDMVSPIEEGFSTVRSAPASRDSLACSASNTGSMTIYGGASSTAPPGGPPRRHG